MYKHLGWKAPYIFCIAVSVIDLIARILVLEKRHYGEGPEQVPASDTSNPPQAVKELSLWGTLVALVTFKRGMASIIIAFFLGLMFGAMEAT